MFLSQYVKTDIKTLFKITPAVTLLMIVMQAALWFVVIQQSHQRLEKQEKNASREEQEWANIVQQSKTIEGYLLSTPSWLTMTLNKAIAPANRLTLSGRAAITEWQGVLEDIQQKFSLILMSAQWQRKRNGEWFGEMDLAIRPPKKAKQYADWLPALITAKNMNAQDWRLVSVLKAGDTRSALVEYRGNSYWLKESYWLPFADASLYFVSANSVILLSRNGKKLTINMREAGGVNE